MTYSSFTLDSAVKAFHLEIVESANLFAEIEPIVPRPHFITDLAKKAKVAAAIGTEKAKSELIVASVLFELLENSDYCISLFSGIDFNVDEENGLTGVCDFLISLSPVQYLLQAPVIALVEAKRDNVRDGLGQCIAEMVAAQRFNTEMGNDIPRVYGATTTGRDWQFLQLEERQLHLDREIYPIQHCDKILGILASMVEQKG